MPHIIHQQKLIIRTRDAGTGPEWQRRIDADVQRRLVEQLELLFNALAPPDRIWRIDTLHLNLGAIPSSGFGEAFVQRVTEAIRHALLGISDPGVVNATPVVKTTRSEALLGQLLFFLDTGRLPWYSTVKDIALWESELIAGFGRSEWIMLRDWLRGTMAPDAVSGMLVSLGARPESSSPALQRLIFQFSDRFLFEWGRLAGDRILPAASVDKGSETSDDRVHRWEKILGPMLISPPDSKEIVPARRPGPLKRHREAATYLDNCGIVLLHPFFELYFAEMGLLAARRFVNEEAASRAVLLLYWLATGRTAAAEFELGLFKLLCGLPADSVLPAVLEWSSGEEAESEHVLRSMLGHWPPMKNSSIDGLRSAFLQRPGKLTDKEGGWVLTIEKKTIDLLLDKLPWGFSTIRLPWMEGVLGVDWC